MSSAAPCPPPLPHNRGRGWWIALGALAIVLIGPAVLLVLWEVVGLFIWTGSLMLVGGRGTPGEWTVNSQRYQCLANREEITLFKEEWATAHDGKPGDMIPPADWGKIFAEHADKLICPLDPKHTPQTSYDAGPIGMDPKCRFQTQHEQQLNNLKKQKGTS